VGLRHLVEQKAESLMSLRATIAANKITSSAKACRTAGIFKGVSHASGWHNKMMKISDFPLRIINNLQRFS